MQEFYGLIVDDLADFVGEPITDEVDVKRATWCLRQAAGLVEGELAGKQFDQTPIAVQNVVISCAGRGYTNPGNYSSESADDWSGSNAPIREMGFYLTGTEKATLARFSGSSSALGSVGWSRGDVHGFGTVHVPSEGGQSFPWYGR